MDIEDQNINPFFVVKQRSEWYQCARCYSDLRASDHTEDCTLPDSAKWAETNRVKTIIKSYFNVKGIEILKGGL